MYGRQAWLCRNSRMCNIGLERAFFFYKHSLPTGFSRRLSNRVFELTVLILTCFLIKPHKPAHYVYTLLTCKKRSINYKENLFFKLKSRYYINTMKRIKINRCYRYLFLNDRFSFFFHVSSSGFQFMFRVPDLLQNPASFPDPNLDPYPKPVRTDSDPDPNSWT